MAPPLVDSLVIVVRHVFPQQVSEVALPQRHYPGDAYSLSISLAILITLPTVE